MHRQSNPNTEETRTRCGGFGVRRGEEKTACSSMFAHMEVEDAESRLCQGEFTAEVSRRCDRKCFPTRHDAAFKAL